jgi:hypothetical protein
MIAAALDWMRSAFAAIPPVIEGAGDQRGLDFPLWIRSGAKIPDEINLDDRLRARGLPPLSVIDQGPVGICTAAAAAAAATYAWADMLPIGNPAPWRQFSPEPIFGWSKTGVPGGNPVPGGSTVTNCARALEKFGCVPMAWFSLAKLDLSRVNGSRAMSWSIQGVPGMLAPIAAQRRVNVARVNESEDQLLDALANGAGVFANLPFTFTGTDSRGMANLVPATHAMAIVGYIRRGPTGKPCYALRQSYGSMMFALSRGKPHPRFPTLGVGLVEADRVWGAIADRRVAFAVTRRG